MRYLLILILAVPIAAQKFAIDVEVQGNTPELEQRVRSFAERELRSLGDVEVVKYGDFTVQLMVLESNLNNGRLVGYIVSYQLVGYKKCDGLFTNQLGSGLLIADTDLKDGIEKVMVSVDALIAKKLRVRTGNAVKQGSGRF